MLEPERTTDRPDLQTLLSLVYEPLLHWDDGRVAPSLVGSWQISENGHSWLLTLREDAHFHDGSLCTVEHVEQALERLRRAKGPGPSGTARSRGVYATCLEDLEIEPQSRTQLLVRSASATGDLADIFTAVYVGKCSDDEHPPIGTGPYMLDDYVEGEFIKLSLASKARNETVYSRLAIFEIRGPEARYDSLLAGQVDLATSLELLPEIPTNDDLSWRRSINTLSVTCFLNGFEEPFCQPEARLAVNLAVDVDSIIHNVWHGLAEPATTVVSPYHFGYPTHLSPHGYNPNRARELFRACSMPDELILRTPLIIPDRAQQVSRLIQQQLSRIGISVIIEVEQDRPKYAQNVSEKRIGHMAVFDSSPLSTYRVLQEKISSERQGLWWQGVKETEADQLIETAHRTVDAKERAEAYKRCLSWLHDNPHWLYLYHPTKLYAHRPEVVGVYLNHAGLVKFALI